MRMQGCPASSGKRVRRSAKRLAFMAGAVRYNCTIPRGPVLREMDLPATMRHVAAREPGPPEVLRLAEAELPRLRPGELLVQVAYAGVNRPDCLQRAGGYPPPADASPI